MSTMNVCIYLSGDIPDAKIAEVPVRFPTHGATNRIAAVLICEKEGFDELLQAEGIRNRFEDDLGNSWDEVLADLATGED
jgi:hypothetical protein